MSPCFISSLSQKLCGFPTLILNFNIGRTCSSDLTDPLHLRSFVISRFNRLHCQIGENEHVPVLKVLFNITKHFKLHDGIVSGPSTANEITTNKATMNEATDIILSFLQPPSRDQAQNLELLDPQDT
jgi:hypothetical protein